MVKARRLSALLLLMLIVCLCLNCCTSPAYAFVSEETPEQTQQTGQAEQPVQTELNAVQDWSNPNTLTPEGNLTVIDDVQPFNSSEKEFLTLQTQSGNYFYLIIERDKDGKQNVHFLNQVDEADLLALLEDEPKAEKPPVCICKGQDKCFAGSVNTACEVCAVDMKGCLGKEPVQTEPEQKDKSNPMAALGVLLALLIIFGAGGFYLFKNIAAKNANKQSVPDFEDFDDDDDDDYLEDEEEVEIEEDTEDDNEEAVEET